MGEHCWSPSSHHVEQRETRFQPIFKKSCFSHYTNISAPIAKLKSSFPTTFTPLYWWKLHWWWEIYQYSSFFPTKRMGDLYRCLRSRDKRYLRLLQTWQFICISASFIKTIIINCECFCSPKTEIDELRTQLLHQFYIQVLESI